VTARAKAGELVLAAFDGLGGDPSDACEAAGSFRGTGTWIASQATQSALVGAGSMIVPGMHLLAFGIDLGVLLHKVAYTSWGIGALLGCPVDGKLDLALVLATWTDAVDDATLAEASAAAGAGLTVGAVKIVGVPAFTAKLVGVVSGEATTAVLAKLSAKGGLAAAGKTADALAGKAALPYYAKKIMTRVSARVATKIATASAGKLIPLVGAAVAAIVNTILVRSIAKAAVRYYTAKRDAMALSPAELGSAPTVGTDPWAGQPVT